MVLNPVRDEFITAGELTFHYVQWGERGSPIVCVCGITANAFFLQAIADDLAKLIDTWGLERPVVLGHSLGGFVALYFAAHYPDKLSKLVLVDAGATPPWKTTDERPAWLAVSMGRLGTAVPAYAEFKQRLKAVPFLGPYWNEYLA